MAEESDPEIKEKTEVYSATMQQAMGGALKYRHELGMNYAHVLPNLIVGSCLQTPSDVDRLKKAGVGLIFCLQQDPDLAYFGVDLSAIQARVQELDGIKHHRSQIRDFDPYDLRMKLPGVVADLHHAKQQTKGAAYIHCTAGLGRAPAVALAYMYWLLGYQLNEANALLQKVRHCYPKLESIRSATCDLLTDGARESVELQWRSRGTCRSVEISGLDVGWGQRIPFEYKIKDGRWILKRQLPVGRYEYKYVVDGNWTYNPDAPLTKPNADGHINNFIEVMGGSHAWEMRQRLMQEDALLTSDHRIKIKAKLEELAKIS